MEDGIELVKDLKRALGVVERMEGAIHETRVKVNWMTNGHTSTVVF